MSLSKVEKEKKKNYYGPVISFIPLMSFSTFFILFLGDNRLGGLLFVLLVTLYLRRTTKNLYI